MSLYDRLGASAKKRISKFGAQGVLSRSIPTYDPVTQQSTTTVQTVTLPVALINVARVRDQRFEKGTLITSSSTGFLIATRNAGMVPMIGDTLLVGAITYRLVWVSPESPQGDGNPVIVTAFGNH